MKERKKEVKGKLEEIKSLRESGINTIRMINSMVISKLRNTFAAISNGRCLILIGSTRRTESVFMKVNVIHKHLHLKELYLRPENLGLSLMDV